jgi:hypothetical protein
VGRELEIDDALKEPESSPIEESPGYVPPDDLSIDDLPHRSPSKRRSSSSSSMPDTFHHEELGSDDHSEAVHSDSHSADSE